METKRETDEDGKTITDKQTDTDRQEERWRKSHRTLGRLKEDTMVDISLY